ncbi:MAG: hypothetical protein ACLSA6_17645 [Holdemania massiliensis]
MTNSQIDDRLIRGCGLLINATGADTIVIATTSMRPTLCSKCL